jgi:ribosomal-protein-alanine acetyltransferase
VKLETGNLKLETALRVRPATAADIPAMLALEKHAVTAAHWSAQKYEEMFAASRYAESSKQQRRVALVVEETTGVQGFLVARVVDREWEIENIAVCGPARRRGLGTRLLGEFLDAARAEGADAVFLEARESNHAALALYEKWAFVESGRRKHYYRDPEEDAIVYRLCFP